MSDFDGESGQVENVKDKHYVAMDKSWEARNNMEMNKMMGYGAAEDMANTAHPITPSRAEKANKQLGPQPEDNMYNYDKDRS